MEKQVSLRKVFFLPGWGFSEKIYKTLFLSPWEWYIPMIWDCHSPETIEKQVYHAFLSSRASIVCGYSLGSLLALDLAAHFPSISDIVLISPTARFTREDKTGFSSRILDRMQKKLLYAPYTVLEDFLWQCIAPEEKDIAKYLLARKKQVFLSPFTPFLHSGLEALKIWDKRNLLSHIKGRVWILSGTSDKICPVIMSQEIMTLVSHSKIKKYEGAGHLLFLSHPQFQKDWQEIWHHIGERYDR